MREGKRILLAPKLWGLLALLLAFNLVLAVTQDWHTAAFYKDYRATLRQYRALAPEEALAQAEQELEAINALSTLEWLQREEDPEFLAWEKEELTASYGEDYAQKILSLLPPSVRVNRFQRQEVLQTLQVQLTHLLDYPDRLRQIQNNVETYKALAIFNKQGSFSARNLEKTGRDFPTEAELQLSNDFAVTNLVEDTVGSYTLLIFTLFLALQFMVERKRGLWSLIHGAPGGRQRLALSRAWVLLLGVGLGTLVLLGGKLLFFAVRCGGLGSLSRNVQSIQAFDDFPWVMPVWVALLGYFLLKLLGMWLVGMAVWAVLQSVNHLPLALCAAVLVLAGEYALYRFIPDSFVTVIFRYVNLFALVDVTSIALHYLNLNFFGWPVQGFLLSIFLIPPTLALLFGLNLLLAARKKPVSRQNSLLSLADRIRVPFSRFVSRLRLFGLELHKLLWIQKGLLILILVAVYSFGVLELQWPDSEMYDEELAAYSAMLQGPITEDTVREIDGRIEEYSSYRQSEAVSRQLDILRRLREKCGESLAARDGRWLIDPEPFAVLMSGNQDGRGTNYQREIAVVLLLALSLLLSGIFSQEHQNRMTQLLHGTPRGGAVLWRKKLGAALLLTCLVWLLFEAGELWQICHKYDSLALAAPIQSFDYFADLPNRVSLGTAVAVYLLLRLLAMLAAAGIILLISSRSRQNNLAILVSCALLVIPACLSYMRIDVLDALSFVQLLSPLEAGTLGYAAAAALGCAAIILSRQRKLG